MKQRVVRQSDFSLGIQNATTWMLRKSNEIVDGRNVRFGDDIGGIIRRNGYIKDGEKFSTTGKLPCGFHTAQFSTGAVRLVACNNDAGTATLIRSQNPTTGVWTTIIDSIPPDTDIYFCDFRDEVYVSGYTTSDGMPIQPWNINKELSPSLTRNLLNVPWAKYFVVYRGVMYAANVSIDGAAHQDRFYKASAPTGAMAFVRGAQTDQQIPLTFINQVPTMTSATAPQGTVTQSLQNTGNEAWRVFDNVSTRSGSWVAPSTNGSAWVAYDYGAGNSRVVSHYSMRAISSNPSANDISNDSPKSWNLEGSNDGTNYTVLHTVNNAPLWSATETRLYTTTNVTSYRYYRINVLTSQGGATWITINEINLYNTLQTVRPLQLKVSSVRYIKPGMNLEVYKSGTSTKLYDLVVYGVDKPNNTFTFNPDSFTISSTNTTTDVITVPDTTKLSTGTPIVFVSTATPPAPFVQGTTYYVINLSSTTLKIATSLDNALLGVAVDITSTGTAGATQQIRLSYVIGNNDEIYIKGGKNILSTLWNTDYPTPEQADWSAIQPGIDSSNEITGVAESSNRLFVFTLNTSNKFDGSSTMAFSKSIGCASMRSIKSIDDSWLVWMTSRGRIVARNESASSQEVISRGIHNRFLSKLTLAQLMSSSAGITDNEYTLYVGSVDGEYSRIVYDFNSNTMAIDAINHPTLMYTNDSSSGVIKPYFVSSNGYVYQDDTGDDDDGLTIRTDINLGETNLGSELDKHFTGVYIYSKDAIGLKVVVSIDGGNEITVGEIRRSYGTIIFPVDMDRNKLIGSVINLKLQGALGGSPPRIYAINHYFNMVQEINGYGKQQ